MYLHAMTLQAVGPFAGRHRVDFAALGASGIFLLEGPTGAGKSTLIDAVVFALYGKVASAASSEDRLRSAYADDETESFVDLTFETGAGVFRVLRSPERLRRKKRGEGTTKQQASIKLWRLPSDALSSDLGEPGDVGELLANRLDEAGLELTRIVGLDRQQFVQTIVLPQGEFANFLRANPEDRRGLLQKVFGTEIYEKAQVQLAAMRATAQSGLVAARTRVDGAVETFLTSAALDTDDAEILRQAGAHDVHKLADEHVAGLEAQAQALTAADALARTALEAARLERATVQALSEAVARREALRAESAALDLRAQEVAEVEATVAAARRGAAVQPAITAQETSLASLRSATTQLHEAHAAAQVLVELPEALRPGTGEPAEPDEASTGAPSPAASAGGDLTETAPVAALEAARSTLRAGRDADAGQVALLTRLLAVEAALPARRSAWTSATAALTTLRETVRSRGADLEERPVARAVLESVRDEARALAADLPVRTGLVERARTLVQSHTQLLALTHDHAEAMQVRAAAALLARQSVEAEGALRQARIAGIAGEIAADLVAGDPCPVCGATEHPQPAALDASHVDQASVDAAEATRQRHEAALGAADQRVALLLERRETLQAAVDGTDAETAASELVAAEEAVAASVAAQSRLTAASAEIDAFDTATQTLRTEHGALLEQVAAEQARLAHEHAALDATEAEITEATGGRRVGEIVDEAAARVAAVDALLAAESRVAAARTAHRERVLELERALETHELISVSAARAAVLPAAQVAVLEQEVARHRRARERVEDGLAEPTVRDLPEEVLVDLGSAVAAQDAAEAAVHETQVGAALAARTAQDAARAAAVLTRASADLDAVEVAAEPVVRMADMAGGTSSDNATRLTLATFVLMRRFEDVVAAANDRLSTMSDGRYELVRSDVKEVKGNTKVGLALRVLDHQTGQPRLPASLSGGETFYVSLCLALGMADVVTAEAGGVALGTLFVDEGFGSLDPETLDSVLAILGRLRAGGRVVGVVSHVEALKQTIADGISVRRLPDGSSTLTVRAG